MSDVFEFSGELFDFEVYQCAAGDWCVDRIDIWSVDQHNVSGGFESFEAARERMLEIDPSATECESYSEEEV